MRARLKVDKLYDADAIGIALVERGANTMPIKVVKTEGEKRTMLDFTKKIFKTADLVPGVLAIAVEKSADSDATRKRIQDAGFSVDHAEPAEGAVLYIQREGADLEGRGIGIIKTDEKIGVICAFSPYTESTSFDENLSQQGFIPGFEMSMGILRETFANSLFKNDVSKDEAKALLKEAVSAFSDHVIGLIDTVPESAFKLDLPEEPAADEKSDETEVAVEASEEPSEEASDEEETPEEPIAASDAKDDEPVAEKSDEDEPAVEEEAPESEHLILSAIEKLGEKIGELGGRIEKAEKAVEKASASADKAVQMSLALDDAIGSQILVSASDDPSEVSEGGKVIPLLDTAMGMVD